MKNFRYVSYLLIFSLIFINANILQSQWTHVNTVSGLGSFYASISVVDPNIVFVAGGPPGTPVIFRSTNGGTNFSSISTTGMNPQLELYVIWGVDANTIYAGDGGSIGGAGGNAHVFKTTNAGATWTTILSTGGTAGFINGIVFSRVNPQVGVIESDPPNGPGTPYWWQLTTNGGNSWTLISGPTLGASYLSYANTTVCIDANFFGNGAGPAGSGDAKPIVTSNGGTSWLSPSLPIAGSIVSCLAFSNDKTNGIAGTIFSSPNLAKTTNGGISWDSINIGTGVEMFDAAKWVPGTNVIYVMGLTGTGGVCKKSTNGGTTWTQMTTAGISSIWHMDLVYVSGMVYAYALSDNGSILKLVENPIGIKPYNNSIPGEFNLGQNYPNPFNPATTIKFDIPKSGIVNLNLFDILGREVAVLVNEKLSAGSYEVTWNAFELPSGVYFYKITTGDFTDTKKMLLVK